MTSKKDHSEHRIKLIYNPNAGRKKLFHTPPRVALENILALLEQYQLTVDLAPTKGPKHATLLARAAKAEGYQMVVVAGGDGTISEAANGLVDGDIPLGIIPLGSYMNIAKMLSVPLEIEKAIAILKIGRTRKIDVGTITTLSGEKLAQPYYFLETSGIGVEAHLQREIKRMEKGHLSAILSFLNQAFGFMPRKFTISTAEENLVLRANMITVANGPFSGATLELAPGAKLNDHLLTIVVYRMKKFDFLKYFVRMFFTKEANKRELKILQSKSVTITTHTPMFVHADASLFGTTPVEYTIKPSCLQVVCGFPEPTKTPTLLARTYLDP